MLKPAANDKFVSAVFLTFSGNCKEALTFYQTCFGGTLQFQIFDKELEGYTEIPVLGGSLVSDSVVIHGSDLVHNEGRVLGNYMAIFIHCSDTWARKELVKKLDISNKEAFTDNDDEKLIEVIDPYGVRWVLYTDKL